MVSPRRGVMAVRRSTTSGALLAATVVVARAGARDAVVVPALVAAAGLLSAVSLLLSMARFVSGVSPAAARLVRKVLTLSQGSKMNGVTAATTTGLFMAGLSALKSLTLISASCAATSMSISRVIATLSK